MHRARLHSVAGRRRWRPCHSTLAAPAMGCHRCPAHCCPSCPAPAWRCPTRASGGCERHQAGAARRPEQAQDRQEPTMTLWMRATADRGRRPRPGPSATPKRSAFNAGKYDEAVGHRGPRARPRQAGQQGRESPPDSARSESESGRGRARARAQPCEGHAARSSATCGDDDDGDGVVGGVSLHEDVVSDDDEAPPLLTLEELRARPTPRRCPPSGDRAMRRKAAPTTNSPGARARGHRRRTGRTNRRADAYR